VPLSGSADTSSKSPLSAPGNRSYSSGTPGGIGGSGYSWLSSAREPSGVFLNFGTQYLNPSSVDYRGYGFQLRSLSE